MMRHTIVPALIAGAAMLGLSGCQQAAKAADPAQKTAIADQIRAMETGWAKDYANRDLARAVSHYAADSMLMPAGMDRMSGPKAIRGGLEGMAKDPNFKLTFAAERVEVADSGDLAYSRGTYQLQMTDPATKQPHVESGNYITTYKKQADGSWKAIDDMSAPGAPAKAAAATPAA
jgi:ketosteroid isomerase-like protein